MAIMCLLVPLIAQRLIIIQMADRNYKERTIFTLEICLNCVIFRMFKQFCGNALPAEIRMRGKPDKASYIYMDAVGK